MHGASDTPGERLGAIADAYDDGSRPAPRRSPCDDRGAANAAEVVEAVRRFGHRLEVVLDQCVEGYGVSAAQVRALEVVATNPAHVSYIARRLRITRQAADRLVRKLEAAGLVTLAHLGNFTDVERTELGATRLRRFRRLASSHVLAPIELSLTPQELRHLLLLVERADDAVANARNGLAPAGARTTWWLE
jgi:DNA-binding MarR family transcriptional regulator